MFFNVRTVFPTAGITWGDGRLTPKALNEQTYWLRNEWEQSYK